MTAKISGTAVSLTPLIYNPSFAAFAELCGGKGIKVTSKEELAEAITTAKNYDGPSIVEIITDVQLV